MTKRFLLCIGLCIFVLTNTLFAKTTTEIDKLKESVLKHVEKRSQQLIEVSDAIWDYAEIALLEHKSAKLLADSVEREGFNVERGVADLSTAFVATYGSGKPVIGILAEYDALPGLSQDSLPYKKAIEEGMRPLREECLRAMIEGHTTINEVLKFT